MKLKQNVNIAVLVVIILSAVVFYNRDVKDNTPPPPIVYKDLTELDKDIERLEKLKGDSLSWQDTFRLGVAYIQKDRVTDAIPVLEDALRKNPDFPKTYESLGMAYFKINRYDKAIELWERALKMEPKAEFLKEMIERAKGKMALFGRISDLEKEMKAEDAGWQKKFELAILYLTVNRIHEAKLQLEEIVKVKKDSADVYDAIAEAHALTGDFDKAIDAEKTALKLRPKNIEILQKRLSEMEKFRDDQKK